MAEKNFTWLECLFNYRSMARTQTPIGKWERSKNELDQTWIEPLHNGQRLNSFWKKSMERNLEIAFVIDIQSYGEISECKNLKFVLITMP